jgi:micrococcal nuclease
VAAVASGDTIIVLIEGEMVSVRYIGVDAPRSPTDRLADEAAVANRDLVQDATVYLVAGSSDLDVYGRLLRVVYLADGTCVNSEIVRLGFARASGFGADVALQEELASAEEAAKAARAGIWAPAPEPTATPEPVPDGPDVRIIALNKYEEYVDIRNEGNVAADLTGWVLLSENGHEKCPLDGVILYPGRSLRIWALAEDAGRGGFNCGYESKVWSDIEIDPAVLLDALSHEVSRL